MPLPVQDEYKVRLEVFEGPLDLLLYLIKKDEVDIYNIPIELITRQYIEYLNLMRMLDLNIAGDFLVMAATLMMIKSRMLLPVEERPELEPEEDDPRWDLVRQLIEYKKFKDAAGTLQQWEWQQGNMFVRGAEEVPVAKEPGLEMGDVNIFDLISAFNDAMKRVKADEIGEIFAPACTVADKIEAILNRIRQDGKILFSGLFENATTRHEVICTFLALLELIRLRQIDARQSGPFREIVVVGVGS
jgi:segregation and condensation protein A